MLKKSGISIEEAFEKACRENDIIFHKADNKVSEIILVDSKGRDFKLDKNLKVVDISDRNQVSSQSLKLNAAKAVGDFITAADLYAEPLYLKTADGVDLSLMALGPDTNTINSAPQNKRKKRNTVKGNIKIDRNRNKYKES